MFTGYFAKIKLYRDIGLIPISIALFEPKFIKNIIRYKKLAPKMSFFYEWKSGSHKGDTEYYEKHFKKEVLDKLNPKKVVEYLEKITETKHQNIILLCWENPICFCHRHLVSKWLNDAGIETKEFSSTSFRNKCNVTFSDDIIDWYYYNIGISNEKTD